MNPIRWISLLAIMLCIAAVARADGSFLPKFNHGISARIHNIYAALSHRQIAGKVSCNREKDAGRFVMDVERVHVR